MSFDLAAQPIEWHVRQAAELAMKTRRLLHADLQPMMHLVLPDGHIQLVQFHRPPGGDFVAMGARMAIIEHKAQQAILIQEGWTVKRALMPTPEHPEVTDPDVRAVIAGRLRPGKLPPHKRGEQLVIYGESADGSEGFATYDIEGDQFILSMSSWEFRDLPGETAFVTRFRPLFMAEALIRNLPVLERAVLSVQAGSDEALLDDARQACLAYLGEGNSGTPIRFVHEWDQAFARLRDHIGWRGN